MKETALSVVGAIFFIACIAPLVFALFYSLSKDDEGFTSSFHEKDSQNASSAKSCSDETEIEIAKNWLKNYRETGNANTLNGPGLVVKCTKLNKLSDIPNYYSEEPLFGYRPLEKIELEYSHLDYN